MPSIGPPPLPPREAYMLWADHYEESGNPVTALDERAVRHLSPPLAGRALLDAGCGTGERLVRVAAAGQSGGHVQSRSNRPPGDHRPLISSSFAVGLDLVHAMLAAGRRRRPRFVPLVNGDIRALPFQSAAFDLVWCRLALGYIAELEQAYREFARVSRPGSAVIVTDFHPAAARAGFERTFRDASGRLHAIEHFVHDPAQHERAARAARLRLMECLDFTVGPDVRGYYERAGVLDRYEAQRGFPLVLALRFLM